MLGVAQLLRHRPKAVNSRGFSLSAHRNVDSIDKSSVFDCQLQKAYNNSIILHLNCHNGRSTEAISLHVPLSQQNVSRHSSIPLHYHSPCFSRWRNHVESPGPGSPVPCHGQGNECAGCKDWCQSSKWRLWRSSSLRWKGKDSHFEASESVRGI